MPTIFHSWLAILLIGFCFTSVHAQSDEARARSDQFEKEIRPVLASKCLKCHGEKKQEGGLRLDSLSSILEGGDSGAALIAGSPDESLLLEALRYESYEMPPTGQLSEDTIEQFEHWIASGAVWPDHTGTLREESSTITEEDRQWWAFQPLMVEVPPELTADDWSQNEIDRFVFKRLRDAGLEPAPTAEPTVLVRRLYFTLLGLPPTPQEIEQYLQDSSPDAWEHLIDRLLQDPRYGEHWARYWLDLVRYSESDGWNQDAYRPQMWRYRDYVVSAFNNDKPYPEFVRQQLAGDEIANDNPEDLIAAGFLRLGIYEYNQRDARNLWNDIVNEMTDVAGDVFLGLSMACCRCHDHKFDPLPQKDYYKLRAFFEPVIWRDDLVAATAQQKAEFEEQHAKWEAATAEVRAEIDALLQPYFDKKWYSTVDKFPLDIQACFHKPVEQRTSWEHQMAYLVSRQFWEEGGGPLKSMKEADKERHEALTAELAKFDDLKSAPLPEVMTVSDFHGELSPTYIPDTGEQEPIEPGFLAVMSSNGEASAAATSGRSKLVSTSTLRKETSGRRTALAEWIGDSSNALTNRVIVNRVWQQHFGLGLVATSSDFGRLGEKPTHPELLDWLTFTFIDEGWSTKQLHKRILMSATWRQSAHHPDAVENQESDPAESLLWRARVRRLQAEQIRDAMLSASGELEFAVGGPSVEEDSPRRSLYVKSLRNTTDTFLHGFDMVGGLKSVPQRDTTTTPIQSLLLINGEYALARAEAMATSLQAEHSDPTEIVSHAIQRAWGRQPTESELQTAKAFVLGDDDTFEARSLADFCHVLFNSNEFLYLE